MTLLQENTIEHEGKTLSHFEDEFGNILKDLHMREEINIVFTDGSQIKIGKDWRGDECYLSQYEN